MTSARPPLPLAAVRAFVASGRLWLVELMAWLAAVFGVTRAVRADLIAELDDLHRAVALLVFAEVRASLVLADAPARAPRPCHAPPGFARARDGGATRALWRSVRRGVGLRARIVALGEAIDDLAGCAARLRRRLARCFRVALVLRVAPREVARDLASACVALRDTS